MEILEVINVLGRPARVEMWGLGREGWTFKGKAGEVRVCFSYGRSSSISGTTLELKGEVIASKGSSLGELRQKLHRAGLFPEEYYHGPGDRALSIWERARLSIYSRGGVITEINVGEVIRPGMCIQ
jgi:hypothetical protein